MYRPSHNPGSIPGSACPIYETLIFNFTDYKFLRRTDVLLRSTDLTQYYGAPHSLTNTRPCLSQRIA